MNSETSKTSELHGLLLNLADKISLKRSDKYVALKGYRFLSFAKNMNKNIGINISRNLRNKYS